MDFWGTGGHEEPTVGPVQEVHLSHPEGRRRHRDPHDVDRHALPGHLLELRQRRRARPCGARRSNASWPSIPGWRTTASTPTSSCRPTPPSRWTTSCPCLRDGDSFQSVAPHAAGHRARSASRKSDYEAVVRGGQEAGHVRRGDRRLQRGELIKGVFDGMGFDKLVSWEEFQEKDYFVVPSQRTGRSSRPASTSSTRTRWPIRCRPHRQAGVLLREPGQGLPQRRGAAADPQVDREGHHPRRADLQQRAQGLSAAGHVQPRPLEGPRPVRRHPLDQGDAHRQGQGLRRLHVRAVLDATRAMPRRGASRTATSSRCSTRGAASSAGRWCGSGSCRE